MIFSDVVEAIKSFSTDETREIQLLLQQYLHEECNTEQPAPNDEAVAAMLEKRWIEKYLYFTQAHSLRWASTAGSFGNTDRYDGLSDQAVLESAFNSDLPDFEDAVQIFGVVAQGLVAIMTRGGLALCAIAKPKHVLMLSQPVVPTFQEVGQVL